MKIALISLSTPTVNNTRAASALPYHIIKYREEGIDVDVYSFNINNVDAEGVAKSEKELGVNIKTIGLPKWYNLILKLHLLIVRVVLKYPILRYFSLPKDVEDEIKSKNPDGIWIYGEELSHIANRFGDKSCVITTPDCEAMYYYRVLSKRGQFTRFAPLARYALMYQKYAKMAEDFPSGRNIKYHLVGKADRDFLVNNINPNLDANFILHPHYDYCDKKMIKFSHPKIKILVAGRYDFYMQDKCDEMAAVFVENAELAAHYSITFLGKGWKTLVTKFSDAGYDVNHITFADNYFEELIKHDIQITPVGVGTGTKGKVLDAFANGLMVIGTPLALENIAVENGKSCIRYESREELKACLCEIYKEIAKYEEIAREGRNAVISKHNRTVCSAEFFKLF